MDDKQRLDNITLEQFRRIIARWNHLDLNDIERDRLEKIQHDTTFSRHDSELIDQIAQRVPWWEDR